MKSTILVILMCAFTFFTKLMAQVCEPELKSSTLIYPDTVLYPCIERNTAFDEPIHLFPPETYQIATVDSIVITGILGLPAGINYACNPSSCVFPGGQHGCISLNGIATDSVGHYHLVLEGLAYLTTSTTGQFTLPLEQMTNFLGAPPSTYGVDVINPGDGCRTVTGISENKQGIALHAAYNSSLNEINYSVATSSYVGGEILLIAADGRLIAAQLVTCNEHLFGKIHTEKLQTGVYGLYFRTEKNQIIEKVIVW